jgi:membrane-associated phospholipid phosphatase
MTQSKPGLVLLLALVFAFNLAETAWESSLHSGATISSSDDRGAYAVRQLEPAFVDFEFHDQMPAWMVYSSSIAYFVVFPALALALLVALAIRPDLAPFRVLCLAVAIDYVVSLPWFLFFPVPERWAYPESSAVLLSDQWTSMLIQSIRPLSGLNNSFPSTHTSLTIILVLVSWLFDVRWRVTVTALGTMVILATFVLGIHWVPDILAGVAAGALSVTIAWRCTDTSERPLLADLEEASALRWKTRPRAAPAITPIGAALTGSRPIRGSS